MKSRRLLILILAAGLTACGGAGQPVLPLDQTPSPTPAAAPGDSLPEKTAPVHDDAPLRFTLPTPVPAPKSLWRPALYQAPWALGPFDHFYFNRPIAADEVNWPLADYRYGGIFFSSEIVHTGVDIPARLHTPVLAAASGRVVWAGYGLYYGTNQPDDPYGLAVTIRHDFGWQGQRLYTVYAHLDRVDVVAGQIVQAGDPLGIVGTTGLTTGPHLHFEVRTDRNSYFTTLNPELWLVPPEGWGVLVGQLRNTNYSILTEQDVVVRNTDTRQKWTVRTYGKAAVNSDPYYRENMVLSDLPAGNYELTIDYLEETYTLNIQIHPGAVTNFSFQGARGFRTDLPPAPDASSLLLPAGP